MEVHIQRDVMSTKGQVPIDRSLQTSHNFTSFRYKSGPLAASLFNFQTRTDLDPLFYRPAQFGPEV